MSNYIGADFRLLAAAAAFEEGQSVWYLDRSRGFIEATISAVDRTIRPWAYSVLLAGAAASRDTEAAHLRPASGPESGASSEPNKGTSSLHAPCPTPSCHGQLSENALQVRWALNGFTHRTGVLVEASCLQALSSSNVPLPVNVNALAN